VDPDVPLSAATETVWAGSYTLPFPFAEKGPHLVRVAFWELGETRFEPPAVFDLQLEVLPAAGLNAGFLLVAFTAILIAAGGIYWTVLRAHSPSGPINLLDAAWLRPLVTWRGFQPALQIPTLAVIAGVAFLGFFDIQDGAKNLATRLTWLVWWPGIIFTFILVGRLWCVMCPFGALNEWAAKLARPRRLFPKSLRSLWLATFLFLILTWADEQLGVIRTPGLTAWLIVVFAAFALFTGIFYQRRSFCRYVCPITGMLGLYSMLSPVGVRSADQSRCQKSCRQDCYRGNDTVSGCPMFEFPKTLERNMFCNVCFECVRSCPDQNIALRLRSFGKDLWASSKRVFDEAYLALVLVGVTTILTAQMQSSWSPWISGLAKVIPSDIRVLMRPVTYLTLAESATFFIGSLLLFPALGFLAAWAATRTGGAETTAKKTFTQFAYMFVPVGLAMHLAHNVSHLITEAPSVVPAFQRAVARYMPLSAGAPNWQFRPLMAGESVYWLEMLLILLGFVVSLFIGHRLTMNFADRQKAGRGFIPFAALSLIFTLVNMYLLNQPMGARH
jgi:hypothetical protein